jgi:phosphomannomutase
VETLTADHGAIHQDKTSVDCPDDRKAAAVDALGERIPDAVAGEPVEDVVTADGFKLLLADGSWLLVRPSGTEPVLRVYAEADSPARVEDLLDAGSDLVRAVV